MEGMTKTLASRLDGFVETLESKGYTDVTAWAEVRDTESWTLASVQVSGKCLVSSEYETFRQAIRNRDDEAREDADVLGTCLTRLGVQLAELPDQEGRKTSVFMAKLASVIELGRNVGVEDGFLNPLVTMMEKLSSNVLEDKR